MQKYKTEVVGITPNVLKRDSLTKHENVFKDSLHFAIHREKYC